MDRRLVGLTARPERERRRSLEERPRLQIGWSRRERLREGSVADAKVVALSTRPVIPCLSRMTSKSDG
jgi:hypothetical protein